jgi:methionine aminotransferase
VLHKAFLLPSFLALVKTNDEVIILDPNYDSYDAPVLLCYAKPIRVDLKDDFSPTWETIEKAFSLKTRIIIINTPHNPMGKILNKTDFEVL